MNRVSPAAGETKNPAVSQPRDVNRKSHEHLDLSAGLADGKGLLQWLAIDGLNASGQFVLPSVPRAGHTASLDGPFGEGPALMGAHAVECVKDTRATE